MAIIDIEDYKASFDDDVMPKEYREFRNEEGIPVHKGMYVNDVNELETGHWKRTGQRGAFINLYGTDGVDDLQIHELEPGGETSIQRHLYEELVYVSQGNGIAAIGEGDNETVFEWNQHSLFLIPYNTPYRYTNLGDEPARLVSQTYLPQLLEMIKDRDLIFDCDQDVWNKYQDNDFYSAEGGLYEGGEESSRGGGGLIWEANFVPNVNTFEKLDTWQNQAGGFAFFRMPKTSMFAHIGEFPVGEYKKAHKHGPGANVFILSGEGYSLLWDDDMNDKLKIDWGPGSIFAPPALWYHHHFNTGRDPARSFALHYPSIGTLREGGAFDPTKHEIEYVDEDPEVREVYRAELEKNGLELQMPQECYTDPDYVWRGE